MYIKNIHIENFRNFHCIDIPLKKLTIVIGENDAGKTNFLLLGCGTISIK